MRTAPVRIRISGGSVSEENNRVRIDSGDGDEIYTIEPGGGANTAEAVINRRTGLIEIYVGWS